jgi:hypothetical protein
MTDAPVIKLAPRPTLKDEIKASVINVLEEALKDARDDKIIDVAIMARDYSGWRNWASMTAGKFERIGAVEVLKHDLICGEDVALPGDEDENEPA